MHIAVIDIGKTNAKLALVDLDSLTELTVITRPNRVMPGPPYPHFDTEGHWAFLLQGLRDFQHSHGVDAISITTHGASAALLAADGRLATPVLDYEHSYPADTVAAYDAIRPDFAETGSPRLAQGLNLGAQLHYQLLADPGLRGRAAHIVTYPQYWAHRLTGVLATDVTSLGCHTDLWNPHLGKFSALVDRLGLRDILAPPRRPHEILGPILPEIAAATGLSADTPVACGIHDSNASLLPHLMALAPPFSVVSTGTWVVVMTVGGVPVTLDPIRDSLINVNAFGHPTPSARFMGGREYEVMRGPDTPTPSAKDIDDVLDNPLFLMPAVDPETGPFKGCVHHWLPDSPNPDDPVWHVALAFYLALMTAECLDMTGAIGEIIIEGPFGRNPLYLNMLAAATGLPVTAAASQTGTAIGAALLFADHAALRSDPPLYRPPLPDPKLIRYAQRWRAAAGRLIAISHG